MSKKEKMPKYLMIEEELKYKILREEWLPGDKINSEEEFCEIYNVSRITVRKAILNLENKGFLYRISGKGTFIANWQENPNEKHTLLKSFTNEMKELGKSPITIDIDLHVIQADKRMAEYLGVEVGDKLIQLKRLRAIEDNDIIAYSVNTFPYRPEFSIDAKDYLGSFYEYLGTFGIYFNSSREYLEAVFAPSHIAHKLKIEPTEPVLKSVKISTNIENDFSEHNLCYYIGKKYRFYINY